jgi:hypothetical protein
MSNLKESYVAKDGHSFNSIHSPALFNEVVYKNPLNEIYINVVFFLRVIHRYDFMCRRFGTLSVPSDVTECSETTSPHEIQTPGNHPKRIQHSKQGRVGNRKYVNVILHLEFKNSPTCFDSLCVRENVSYMFSLMMTLTESKRVVDLPLNFKCKLTLKYYTFLWFL